MIVFERYSIPQGKCSCEASGRLLGRVRMKKHLVVDLLSGNLEVIPWEVPQLNAFTLPMYISLVKRDKAKLPE